jgi:hypothetical protein
MRKIILTASAATLFLGGSGASLMAQAPQAAVIEVEVVEVAVRDPQTLAALDKMGAALRNLKSFSVRADTTEERVLTTGQKIQNAGYVETKVQFPGKLRMDRVNDRQARSMYLDGKTLTIYSPRMGFYGQVPATGSIREVVAAVADNYDIETPLADLLAWGEDPTLSAKVKSAFYVGAETVNGNACDQYAMRQDDVDWQVWIRQKGAALPCKLVITSTDDPSLPQYSAVYTWMPQQTHAASTFTFVPPKDSHKIPIEKKAPAVTAAAQ